MSVLRAVACLFGRWFRALRPLIFSKRSGELRHEGGGHTGKLVEKAPVRVIKGRALMGIDVYLANQHLSVEYGNHHFRLHLWTARKIVVLRGDILDHKSFFPLCRLTAYSSSVGNLQVVGRLPTERAEHQKPLSGNRQIEAEPIVV